MIILIIKSLKINGYKNLKNISIEPDGQYNLITGDNAQGKTNLLEAIWTLTGCRNLRGSKEKDCIGFGMDSAEIEMQFSNRFRTQSISVKLLADTGIPRRISLNKIPLKDGNRLFEAFKCVAFMPDDVDNLINGSPEKRRNFVDLCRCQLNPSAMSGVRRLSAITAQRNAILRKIPSDSQMRELAGMWDEQLEKVGSEISLARFRYIKKLQEISQKLYSELTANTEKLELIYRSNVFSRGFDLESLGIDELIKIYSQKIMNAKNEEIKMGYTFVGTGRDDIIIKSNNLNIRDFGSQGQKQSIALVLRLAQAVMLKEKDKEPPVILLDDVMGPLDKNRRGLIHKVVSGMQVFITSCNDIIIPDTHSIKCYEIKNGIISEGNILG